MRRRIVTIAAGLGLALSHGVASAQATSGDTATKPNLNWVFDLAVVTLVGFLAFIGFIALYYVLAVVARSRRFATVTPAVAGAPARTVASAAAAPTVATPPAAAPIPAPSAAPAATPPPAAPPKPAPAPAASGGLPHIDPNNLPDGIDAVTRGRLKKLAVLQERGQEPPADLVEELKGVLAQLAGSAPPIEAEAPAVPEPAAAPAAQAAPEPVTEAAPAAAPAAPEQPAAPEPAPAAPATSGGLPHIDPNNLPDGIDAVARGRLKKLAIFQERGTEPPAELVESLKPILEQLGG